MKNHTIIHCIVCDYPLNNMEYETKDDAIVEVHPTGGLHFRTYGHYGSGIFDPMGKPDYLDVAICDVCIMEKLDQVRGIGVHDLRENAEQYINYAHKNRRMEQDK